MVWIGKVSMDEADGRLKTIFEGLIKRAGRVCQIVHIQSQNPPVLQAALEMYRSIMYGPSALSAPRVNYFIYTVVRVDGREHADVSRRITFRSPGNDSRQKSPASN